MHAVAEIAKVDGGMAGDAPRNAGWSHGAARDWGGARRGMWHDGDGRDREGPVDGRRRHGGRSRCELTAW